MGARAGFRASVTLALALGLVASACTASGLQFREDDRVAIHTPAYREKVRLPLTIEWDARGFDITGPTGQASQSAGYFAVLIDTEPLPPGESLAYYGRDDTSCRPAAGCPDEEYLAARGVFTATETEFRVERLAPTAGVDVAAGDRDRHEVTIILLDGTGRRIGESVWTQPFEVVRDG